MIPILLGLSVFYFTTILLFSIEHNGPYMSLRHEVALAIFSEETKERSFLKRPVDLFDRFRRLFGLYAVVKDSTGAENWITHSHRLRFWQCPHCLGFWIAFCLAILVMLIYQDPQNFLLNWWSAAGFNSLLVRFLNRES